MITQLVIGIILAIVGIIALSLHDKLISRVIGLICVVITTLIVSFTLHSDVPKGYLKVDSYTYITETNKQTEYVTVNVTESDKKQFYTKDDKLYLIERDVKFYLIPFRKPQMKEVQMDKEIYNITYLYDIICEQQ